MLRRLQQRCRSCQVGIGRDHTLYALEPGFVTMYKMPKLKKQTFGSRNVLSAPTYRNMLSNNPGTGQLIAVSPQVISSPEEAPSVVGYNEVYSKIKKTPDGTLLVTSGTKDLIKRRERRFIGIVFDKDEVLPRNLRDEGRSRRLGLEKIQPAS